MPEHRDEIKTTAEEIAANTHGTPTVKLVAVLIASGVTCNRRLAEIAGLKIRAIQAARRACASAAECAQQNAHAHYNAPEAQQNAQNAAECAQQNAPLARAYKESPTEIGSLVKDKNIMSETVVSDNVVKMQPRAKRRHSYTSEFEAFWGAYPAIGNSSKSEAFKQWRLLLPAEQLLAREGLQHLAAHCRANPTYTCVHACRYLSQRRWESYETPAQRLAPKPAPAPEWLIMQRIGEEMLRVNGEC